MKELSSDFTLDNRRCPPEEWSRVVGNFIDANIYQTSHYETVRSGNDNHTHVVLKHRGDVAAAAQARTVRIPFLGLGLAYVRWGPLWQRAGNDSNPEVFRQMMRAMRHEYAGRRRMVLRVVPRLPETAPDDYRTILQEEGYEQRHPEKLYHTILMDLQPSLDDLQRALHQKWRNCLNAARKKNLEIIEGDQDELFLAFESIYSEMVDRKQFSSEVVPDQFRRIQQMLPSTEKMRVVLCKLDGKVCAGAIASAIGDTGIYLLGATSNEGMKTNGSYLAQWKLVEWLKQQGCRWYDLNGINPITNEGTYRFKSRLAGASGRELKFVGQFDAYPNSRAKLMLLLGENLRARLKAFRNRRTASEPREAPPQQSESKAV